MKKIVRQPVQVGMYMVKWLCITGIIGLIMGGLSAFFLSSLTWVTNVRLQQGWLLFFLPVAGALFTDLYLRFGKGASQGNNLVIRRANGEEENIPWQMIPLTLFGTLSTHLFGGSAGREGTAVQMGGAVAQRVGQWFHLEDFEREIVIISGISAGFSSVFGTPLAGTIFGIEVLILGRIRSEAIFPSFFAAFFSNFVTESFGITHTHYALGAIPDWSFVLFCKLFVAGIAFGLTGWLFSHAIRWVKQTYARWIARPVLRSFVGGSVVVLLAVFMQTDRYLGLGLPLIQEAFQGANHAYDFLGKLVFTALTLGAGFQGGEVTPLFDIGATLGSTLAQVLQLSIPFVAGLGFIGVFAGATNTPIACFIMGIELFGGEAAWFFFFICVLSYLCSGNAGIYSAQKVPTQKAVLLLPLMKKSKNKL